ncbi:MAG: MCD, Malonyl-CoA decarboxylase MCD [Hyphomicrobium sp.]|nr:MAG: MCD, Malonyl-CoA decarboxylase MCD [Hyphomicrobium sp.]
MNTVAEQSRALLPKALFGPGEEESLDVLARALMSGRGEASGVAIARQLLNELRKASADERRGFYRYLADELQPNAAEVARAAEAYLSTPSEATLTQLQKISESPRREFFRRLNLAPGATAEIVALRRELLRLPKGEPGIASLDADLEKLLTSWFNRGFLVLRRIDWQTPAAILEKIIAYEAVHEIKGWDDLRRRLDPQDRRCFAFFHPALVDEPLIFVEVALMQDIPDAIAPVLSARAGSNAAPPTTAVFYSISNCQDGLRGISFGNFLLKQVVEDLLKDVPSLKTFVTLSPVPTFARWLDRTLADESHPSPVSAEDKNLLKALRDPRWIETDDRAPLEMEALKATLLALAAHYFLVAKSADARPVDPVARFHLGNGARLERINWLGDISEKGLREAHGLMVNYRYEPGDIERNHEAYAQDGFVAASRSVRGLLRTAAKAKGLASVPDLLALPGVTKAKKKIEPARE